MQAASRITKLLTAIAVVRKYAWSAPPLGDERKATDITLRKECAVCFSNHRICEGCYLYFKNVIHGVSSQKTRRHNPFFQTRIPDAQNNLIYLLRRGFECAVLAQGFISGFKPVSRISSSYFGEEHLSMLNTTLMRRLEQVTCGTAEFDNSFYCNTGDGDAIAVGLFCTPGECRVHADSRIAGDLSAC